MSLSMSIKIFVYFNNNDRTRICNNNNRFYYSRVLCRNLSTMLQHFPFFLFQCTPQFFRVYFKSYRVFSYFSSVYFFCCLLSVYLLVWWADCFWPLHYFFVGFNFCFDKRCVDELFASTQPFLCHLAFRRCAMLSDCSNQRVNRCCWLQLAVLSARKIVSVAQNHEYCWCCRSIDFGCSLVCWMFRFTMYYVRSLCWHFFNLFQQK